MSPGHSWMRRSITKAFYGVESFELYLNPITDEVDHQRRVIDSTGMFLRHLKVGKPPTNRRIAGVLYLEQCHDVGASPFEFLPLLARNPFAARPLPKDIWGAMPQCDIEGELLRWTDRFGEGPDEAGE